MRVMKSKRFFGKRSKTNDPKIIVTSPGPEFKKLSKLTMIPIVLLIAVVGVKLLLFSHAATPSTVAGENYMICNETSQYLTSPYTYDSVPSLTATDTDSNSDNGLTSFQASSAPPASSYITFSDGNTYSVTNVSGSTVTVDSPMNDEHGKTFSLDAVKYTVAQYQALSGYGTTLPSLPSYISSESSSTEAAVIFAPGSTSAEVPSYDFPGTPLVYYLEGGTYGPISFGSVSGNEYIGGSATGYPEPTFNNASLQDGINGGNASYDYSGGSSTLAITANSGTDMLTTSTAIPGYINYISFPDGTTYQIAPNGVSGTSITLNSALTKTENSGTIVWANRAPPNGLVTASASQGATTVTLGASNIPFETGDNLVIGSDTYRIQSISGSESGYTLTIVGGLDASINVNTPFYYNGVSSNVTVEYLNISNDLNNVGTIITVSTSGGANGVGWIIEHNNIHDGYNSPGQGVAIYGGDQSTIEYNCLSKEGDYGINSFGTNDIFDYNEVYESNYKADPGCGCSGGGKWWGTLNANIVDNAFINDGIGGGGAIWLDNGNTGTLIQGNYFYKTYGRAISNETGFNLDVNDNMFVDDNWGSGSSCGNSNCTADVGLNSSGGFNVPNSRYNNETLITDNQFINDWGGVGIWQSGERSCENSGESWPDDASYCSGGFPNSANLNVAGQYYFSHISDNAYGGTDILDQNASANSSTVMINGSEAIDDQIGFGNAAKTKTTDTTNVTTLSNGTINANTSGFPSYGELVVNTLIGSSGSAAIVSYSGTNGTQFTGVTFILGSGTLNGTIYYDNSTMTTTTNTANVTSLNNSTVTVNSTTGFPSSGELRVGTSAAWSDAGGSYTGAILSYTGTNATQTQFTGVSLLRGSGTLAGPVMEVQPYKVTSETCYANDCAVSITPSLSSAEAAGTEVVTSGTCQLFATSAATPTSPLAPNSSSYYDGCQWGTKNISVSGNTFDFNPTAIATGSPVTGGTSTTCTANNANNCGTNFMAFQEAGEAPFSNFIVGNAMMSNSSLTGCPTWDLGCSTNPLSNLNALSSPPNAPANNGEPPENDVWSNNTYAGPWLWDSYSYGTCIQPTDSTTNKSMPSGACTVNFANWQSVWEQDLSSTYNASGSNTGGSGTSGSSNPSVSITSPSANTENYGTFAVDSTASANDGGSIASVELLVNGAIVQTLTSAPYNFNVNSLTANYHDGTYTIEVLATDDQGNQSSASQSIYIANGDLNLNHSVGIDDLAVMAANWTKTNQTYSQGNITGNGAVGIADLAILASNWGWSEGH